MSLRDVSPKLELRTQQFITTLGCACWRHGRCAGRRKCVVVGNYEIPVVTGNRRKPHILQRRQPTLTTVETSGRVWSAGTLAVPKEEQLYSVTNLPSLYVLNTATLAKPYAVQHLTTGLTSYNIDVAIINETHCKSKHSDSVVSVDGYVMYRQDRVGGHCRGVVLYVWTTIPSAQWKLPLYGISVSYSAVSQILFNLVLCPSCP